MDLSSTSFGRLLHGSSTAVQHSSTTLTEESILEQPFYTVVTPSPSSSAHDSSSGDYRNLISSMLLSLKITSPESLKGRSLGDHLERGFDWSAAGVGQKVEKEIQEGMQNTLCLAHGRRPIVQVCTVL